MDLDRCLCRIQFDAAVLRHRGEAAHKAVRERGKNDLDRRGRIVGRGNLRRVVGIAGERRRVPLLGTEPVGPLNCGPAVHAVHPLAVSMPGELSGRGRRIERGSRSEQGLNVSTVFLARLGLDIHVSILSILELEGAENGLLRARLGSETGLRRQVGEELDVRGFAKVARQDAVDHTVAVPVQRQSRRQQFA